MLTGLMTGQAREECRILQNWQKLGLPRDTVKDLPACTAFSRSLPGLDIGLLTYLTEFMRFLFSAVMVITILINGWDTLYQ